MSKTSLLLPVALLTAVCAGAQTTGTSHPELLDDQTSSAVSTSVTTQMSAQVAGTQGDHYRKPSAGVPVETATTTTTTAVAPVYVPGDAASPGLQRRQVAAVAVPGSGTQTFTVVGPATATYGAAPAENDADGVVTRVELGPYELGIGTILKTQLAQEISTETTAVGTAFRASLTQPVLRDGRVLLPVGTTVNGRITKIHGGRRISGGSAIRLQADSVTLPDGVTRRLLAEVTDLDHFRDSKVTSEGTIVQNTHGKTTAAVIGGTTAVAAVTGAVIGGGVGAAVGAGVGASVGLVVWLRQDRQQRLPQGTEIVFALDAPLDLGAR